MDHNRPLVYIALGSNMGDRLHHLQQALQGLQAHPDIFGLRASPIYESEAHTLSPADTAPAFLNAVVEGKTALAPEQLLAYCQALEERAGRERGERWGPRPLDLDLLLYDQVQRKEDRLTLPHPRIGERRFVLQPLADLAPNLYVPSPFDDTVTALLDRCTDAGTLERLQVRLSID